MNIENAIDNDLDTLDIFERNIENVTDNNTPGYKWNEAILFIIIIAMVIISSMISGTGFYGYGF